MKKFVFLLAILILVIFSMRVLIKNIKADNVICKNQYGVCRIEISEKLDELKGISYFSAKNEIVGLLKKSISIKKYSVRFLVPNTLRVDYIEDSPMIALQFGEDRFIPIDINANKFGSVTQTQLPTVKVSVTEEEVDLPYIVKMTTLLADNYDIANFELARNAFIAKMGDGLEVVFPVSGDTELLLGSFEIVLSQLNSNQQEIRIVKSIDFRFNNPVLK